MISRSKAILSLVPSAVFTEADGELIWQTENIAQPTEEEINAEIERLSALEPMRRLRIVRDKKIAETDWWVLADRTPTQEQLDYRQALRDITDNYSSLDDVVWPEKP